LNPFKQQDEEAVLAEKSHNRRRWSHVFPLGEIEFKRHAGPNWKSLSQPAILPLTIDYYPPPKELITFLIRTWDIPLADIERGHYKSHSDLMMEMIRQRITQDYQIVPQSVVQESRRRAEAAAQLVAQDSSRIREDTSPSPMARSFLTSPESIDLGKCIDIRPREKLYLVLRLYLSNQAEYVCSSLKMESDAVLPTGDRDCRAGKEKSLSDF
jgi:hypothetical protein